MREAGSREYREVERLQRKSLLWRISAASRDSARIRAEKRLTPAGTSDGIDPIERLQYPYKQQHLAKIARNKPTNNCERL
jgi:hypothetical protein